MRKSTKCNSIIPILSISSTNQVEKVQLLINNVESHGRKKIDKICHFRPFSKIHKMQTQGTSLKLPTLKETRNSMKSGKRIENSTLPSTFFGIWCSFTLPIILRLKIHASSDRHPVQIWRHNKRINKEKP